MKKLFITFTLIVCAMNYSFAQDEQQEEKTLWAKSFIGQKAPEFTVETWLTSEPKTKGKYILVEFWATWCGPCRKAIPKLNELQKKFSDKLVIIGVSDEPADKVKGMKSPLIEYSSAVDTRSIMKRAYEVKGIPHAVMISPDGVVVWEGFPLLPGFELTEEVVKGLLK